MTVTLNGQNAALYAVGIAALLLLVMFHKALREVVQHIAGNAVRRWRIIAAVLLLQVIFHGLFYGFSPDAYIASLHLSRLDFPVVYFITGVAGVLPIFVALVLFEDKPV